MKRISKRALALILSLVLMMTVLCSCDFNFDLNALFGFGRLKVHFLDVGQGDSIYIELPNGESMLIDSGENYRGEGILNYIKDSGRTKIDYLIGTHPHTDHIGSMAFIVRNIDIGSVYLPKAGTNTSAYSSLLRAVKKKGLKIKTAKAGVSILASEDLNINVVAPVKIDEENLNDCSAVIKLTYKSNSFLFTGDAEKAELESIKEDVSAKVLKVGHHGSYNSTTKDFLERVTPEIAVISCGKGNDYGHPNKSVLKLLKNAGCEIYRTDRQKTITVTGDGETLSVSANGDSIKDGSKK